jgi:two-component system OmpR family response regulator/two-component system response regulator QseB
MRILLVEDDQLLGETISDWLRMDHYAVDWLRRGDLADTALLAQRYACVLLDRSLPGLSGDALLARLRARRNPVPVMLITAQDELAERVTGLDKGADDYLVKPFDLGELSARIRAAVRRFAHARGDTLRHGGIELEHATRSVRLDGVPVALTAREYSVLLALILQAGSIIGRDQLEDTLYAWGQEIGSNAVEVYVHQLRRKLGVASISTVRGLGYRLNDGDAVSH